MGSDGDGVPDIAVTTKKAVSLYENQEWEAATQTRAIGERNQCDVLRTWIPTKALGWSSIAPATWDGICRECVSASSDQYPVAIMVFTSMLPLP